MARTREGLVRWTAIDTGPARSQMKSSLNMSQGDPFRTTHDWAVELPILTILGRWRSFGWPARTFLGGSCSAEAFLLLINFVWLSPRDLWSSSDMEADEVAEGDRSLALRGSRKICVTCLSLETILKSDKSNVG